MNISRETRRRARAWSLAHAMARAYELAYALDLDLARDIDLNLACDRSRARARDLAVDLNNARHLFLKLFHPDGNFVHDLNDALGLAVALGDAHDLGDDLIRNRARYLENVVKRLAINTASLVPFEVPDRDLAQGASRSRPPIVVVGPTARRVLNGVARLLPVEHRQAKAEEFASELYDIAENGASRKQQLVHAVRVLITVMPLRKALSGQRSRAMERG